MPVFMVRVELHGATKADYEVLHKAMETAGFSRKVKGTNGTWYHLPTAEYDLEGRYTTSDALSKAETAAQATGKASSITACRYVELVMRNLQPVD